MRHWKWLRYLTDRKYRRYVNMVRRSRWDYKIDRAIVGMVVFLLIVVVLWIVIYTRSV